MPLATEQLIQRGQSVWLDYIRRGLLRSGEVDRMVAEGWITGMTSNPTIFDKAISESGDYEEALQAIIRMGEADPYDAFVALASEDIQLAADALRPVYEATAAVDGYVSLEVPPGIEHDCEATVAEALRLFPARRPPQRDDQGARHARRRGGPDGAHRRGRQRERHAPLRRGVYEGVAEAYIAGLDGASKRALHSIPSRALPPSSSLASTPPWMPSSRRTRPCAVRSPSRTRDTPTRASATSSRASAGSAS